MRISGVPFCCFLAALLPITHSGCQAPVEPPELTQPTPSVAPPDDVSRQVVDLVTEDGKSLWAISYQDGSDNPTTGVIAMHPRSDRRRDWRLPYFARAGMVGLGMATRHENSPREERYEEILLDLAAGVRYLREEVGVAKVILVGHSGGGSLMTYYAQQSARKPPDRVASTFTGRGPNLNQFELPPVDLLVISAAHFGNPYTVLRKIDPSVTDEEDPTSVDPSLDMYNPANGFRPPPESSSYSKEFLDLFAKAQKERVDRLTRIALSRFREKQSNQLLMQSSAFKELDPYQQLQIERKATTQHYLRAYRLWAIPRFTDLSLDADDRVVGSNRSNRTDWDNYATASRPHVIPVETFLDTYSRYAHVDLLKQIKEVRLPTLFICGTADMQEYPSEREAMLQASGAEHKELIWIEGANHSYLPSGPKGGDGKQRDRASQAMLDFIHKYLETS